MRRFGEIKGFGFGGVLEAFYHFYYSPRGRGSSYFDFTSTFWADFRGLLCGFLRSCLDGFMGCLWLVFLACIRGCLGVI